ncbi:MAG: hypothetical protein JW798_09270 [Prolixibacteraceae bacterium]|nr:hypothetical protein [Prolixibacteraceae bacterium]
MKTRNSALFILLLFSVAVTAQENVSKPENGKLLIIFENGLLAGHPDGTYPAPFSSNLSIVYELDKRLLLGAGSGAEIIGKTFVPFFADIRILPFKSKPLFIYGKAGYTLCLNNSAGGSEEIVYYDSYYYPSHYPHPISNDFTTHGGLLIESGLGVIFRKNNWGTSISLGYRYQQTKDITTNLENEMEYENYFNRLALRVGFWF